MPAVVRPAPGRQRGEVRASRRLAAC